MPDDVARMQRVIERIERLPTLPSIVAKLTRLLADSRTANVKEVTALLSEDQALTAKILRLANSAYYGFPGQVSTLQQAVILLGFTGVRDVALSASVIDLFGATGTQAAIADLFDVGRFWEHSIGCAAACRLLAAELGPGSPGGGAGDPEECFVTGLLHDIGKLIMVEHLQKEMLLVLRRAATRKETFVEAERPVELSHAGLGRYLIEAWNLPRAISEGVGFHHSVRPRRETAARAALVHFADLFTRARGVGYSGDPFVPPLEPEAERLLGLDRLDLRAFIARFDEEMLNASVFIDLVRRRGGVASGGGGPAP